ncbi:hypothetical protein WAF17_21065 [Bernardetia sp. ABR2-2B]|uniref:hypothetical protein n=1 Tax=Bernardetia sp. ABR2-2B TaxID=3127472 RepID=UPI0030D0589E
MKILNGLKFPKIKIRTIKYTFKKGNIPLVEVGIQKAVIPFSFELLSVIMWQCFLETNTLFEPTQKVQIPTYRAFVWLGLEFYIKLKIYHFKKYEEDYPYQNN